MNYSFILLPIWALLSQVIAQTRTVYSTTTVTVIETISVIAIDGVREKNTIRLDNGNGRTFTSVVETFTADRFVSVLPTASTECPLVNLELSVVAKAQPTPIPREMSQEEFAALLARQLF